MKHFTPIIITAFVLFAACTSQKKLAYLNNLPETDREAIFISDIPDYRIQSRDILYITIKAVGTDGRIKDFLSSGASGSSLQDASGGYLSGFVVNPDGNIIIPSIGTIKVEGLTLDESRELLQNSADNVFNNSTVECKLQSFRFTVIGEVNNPGAHMVYNNYLTVFEAIGYAGGIGDYGNRKNLLIIRSVDKGTKTFSLNLQDKQILSSEGYYLLPNDIVVVQALNQKIFNMNLPTISFILSTVTATISTTLLLIFFFRD